MPKYQVAHIREQGQDIIIILVNRSFTHMSSAEQEAQSQILQECATSAGLAGTVVPVWDAGNRRLAFYAPREWQTFFRGLTLAFVSANINKELTCT